MLDWTGLDPGTDWLLEHRLAVLIMISVWRFYLFSSECWFDWHAVYTCFEHIEDICLPLAFLLWVVEHWRVHWLFNMNNWNLLTFQVMLKVCYGWLLRSFQSDFLKTLWLHSFLHWYTLLKVGFAGKLNKTSRYIGQRTKLNLPKQISKHHGFKI